MVHAIELYLVRHGIAAERGEAYPDDTKRPLTSKGMARLRREARGLVSLGITLDQIFTSPLVRARQTAMILAEELSPKPRVVNLATLAPGGSPAQVFQDLARTVRHSRIALVGHEPDMGHLAARLLGTRADLQFRKGAICRVDVTGLPPTRPAVLHWFATPRMLRRIGSASD